MSEEEALPVWLLITKAGWKTTEFWMTLAVILLSNLMAQGLVAEGSIWAKLIGYALSVLAALGYQRSRTQIKKLTLDVAAKAANEAQRQPA